jgi:large subunit ribosomal protein L2
MPLKKFNPITPTRRQYSILNKDVHTTDKPFRPLTGTPSTRSSGRGHGGKISVRRRGGGHKRLYRQVDFRRNKFDIPAVVQTIEYDPNRTANIALLKYKDGSFAYILAPEGLKIGAVLESGRNKKIEIGNAMPMDDMPLGTEVHNIELHPGKGGQFARAAGAFAIIMAKEGDYITLRMPSGEMRNVLKVCLATIGHLGNMDHMNVEIGKAGRSRWLGRRPKVRGVAMNPVDHPLGGGEGKTSGGRNPLTPWGKPTRGFKTVRKYNKLIIRRRGKK